MGPDDPRKRIAELEAEIRILRTMLESAPDFVTRITVDGKFLYLNRLAPGFRMEDVVGTSADAYVPEAHRERAHEAMRAATQTRTVQQYATVGRVSADRLGHYLTRVSPVIEDDQVTSLVMIATDVTELVEQRMRLQVALDSAGQGSWTYHPKEGRASWDDQTLAIFGLAGESAVDVGSALNRLVHPDDRVLVTEALRRAQTTGRFGPIEHRIQRPDGAERWVSASGLAVHDDEGNVASLIGSVQDITERRAFEKRLLEAEKLESVGRLAGGVAHDFNNLLTAVFGSLDFAEGARTLEEVRPLLDVIRLTAERSAALTAQLLAFARRQVMEPKVIDPNAVLHRLDALLRRTIGEHIRMKLVLSARGRVRADESQLEQVVMNLATNARDAMASGGMLTLETLDVELDEAYAASHSEVRPGPYVLLAVSDTGAGIAPEDLPHVFEPFFTRRAGGTGLGLATCYGIVKQSGGHVSVYSEPGQGTTFKAYLPRLDEEPLSERQTEAVVSPGSGERVLVVEDEQTVRDVIGRTLERQGYRVVAAASAEEAYAAVAGGARFDLLVSDVVLPGTGGRALSDELVRRYPGLRVLFVSGYTENAIVHGGELDPGIHFLQKPFRPVDLLIAVRRALEAPPTNGSDTSG